MLLAAADAEQVGFLAAGIILLQHYRRTLCGRCLPMVLAGAGRFTKARWLPTAK